MSTYSPATATLDTIRTAVALDNFLVAIQQPEFHDEFNARVRDRLGSGTNRRKLRDRMLDLQGYVCTKCGNALQSDDTNDAPQWAHLVPATFHGAPQGAHAGSLWGNLTVWHTSCNAAWGERVVTSADLARPDLWFHGTTRDLPSITL
jgi:5-methylcytosine-specific restriction endonuclease McrA